jgi:pyruvate/2-oxoglutarate dehydrogenase complex dihydrolipoamide acyltransferase (E2) component
MSKITTIHVPDIGDFAGVEIIEVLVQKGDVIAPEDPILTLESDKASMDIPAPSAGTVTALHVKVGDRISEGDAILDLELSEPTASDSPDAAPASASESATEAPPSAMADTAEPAPRKGRPCA